MPDVPTTIELGYNADVVAWRGIAAPKGTPKEVVDYNPFPACPAWRYDLPLNCSEGLSGRDTHLYSTTARNPRFQNPDEKKRHRNGRARR